MALTSGEFFALMQREVGDAPPDVLLAKQWAQHRYASVLERFPWNFLRKEATFNTTAAITAGTVTVTLGSATVTETTSNANGWSSAVETRYFRRDSDNEFYPIDTFTDANPDTLTLNRVYEQPTATASGYTIFQRFYALASDVREVSSMCSINDLAGEMIEVSQEEMDRLLANRPSEGQPRYWAMAGLNSSNVPRIEVYPIPDEAQGILYHYIQTTPDLADGDTTIFPQVTYGLLRSGWLADYWSWRAARSDAPPQSINMSAKMEAEFEKRLKEFTIRELGNVEPQRMRFELRHTARRMRGKFSSPSPSVRMP